MNIDWRRLGTATWKYTIPLLLLGQLGFVFLTTLTVDPAPVAQAPPDGYHTVQTRTRVVWASNGLDGKFEVQVIPDGGDFAKPTITKQTDKTNLFLPLLDLGTTYHWRVVHVASGQTSNVMTFHTSKRGIWY